MKVGMRGAVVALGFGMLVASQSAAGVPGQPIACAANAAIPPVIRAIGVAELVGDLVIVCTGGTPTPAGTNVPQVNIEVSVQPSINVTSRVLSASGSWTEALLLIDEPAPAGQRLCGAGDAPEANPGNALPVQSGVCARVEGTGTGVGTYDVAVATTPDTDFYRVNAFQGRRVIPAAPALPFVLFAGVPFDPPGQGTRILRITNVRLNAAQLGVPAGAQAPAALTIATNGTNLANPISLPITSATQTVAFAINPTTFEVLDAQSFLQNVSVNPGWVDGGFPAPTLQMSLRYTELFRDVFLRRSAATTSAEPPVEQDVPGQVYVAESGFFRDAPDPANWPEELTAGNQASGVARGRVSGTAAGTLGLADHGSRLIASFSDVPQGVRLFVENAPPITQTSPGNAVSGALQLVPVGTSCAGAYSAVPANPQGFTEVPLVGGAGIACWEVLTADHLDLEQAVIQVLAAYESDVDAGLPALGVARVAGQLAPLNPFSVGGNATIPIPRFVSGMVQQQLFAISSGVSDIPAASRGTLLTLALLLGIAAAWTLRRRG